MSDCDINIYLMAAMGDALGTGVYGLRPEAVKSFYGDLDRYINPEEHLSHKIYRWTKPGYYSFITQMALLVTDALLSKGKLENNITKLMDEADQRSYSHFRGIFRNSSGGFEDCLDSRKMEEKNNRTQSFFSGITYPFICRYSEHPDRAADELIQFILTMNNNCITLSAALATLAAITCRKEAGSSTSRKKILEAIADRTETWEQKVKQRHSKDIDMMSLPFLGNFSSIIRTLSLLDETATIDEGTKLITKNAKEKMRMEINRPGHPEPLACVVTGIFIGCSPFTTPHESLFKAAQYGQGANITASIAGAVQAAGFPERIEHPSQILTGLANYKQIILRAEAIDAGNFVADMKDFRTMEHSLTQSVSLDLEKLIKKYPVQEKQEGPRQKDFLDDMIIKPLIPDRKNKRLWRDYEREKTKKKKRRRDFIDYPMKTEDD